MLSSLEQMRRLEQRMSYVRWFAVLFGVVSVAIQPRYPDHATEIRAWLLVAILAIGSLAIWGSSARIQTAEDHRRLGDIAFVFDSFVVMSLVWVFAYEIPYVTWALLFVLPLEGALRHRLKGAMVATLAVTAFFIPQSLHRAHLLGDAFDFATYVFVVSLSGLIAGVTGTMANQWQEKSRALEEQSLRLAEIDQLKDRFLAITSHEIRGPLTAILGAVDTIRTRSDRLTPEQSNKLLEMASRQAHQLARLVDDLQITSRLQSGQLTLQNAWADLEGTVNEALEAAASKRRQHHLEVFIEPLECEIDAARVGQIVRNLVENAYKYTPDGTRVAVTAKEVPHGLQLEVADAGKGIPADKRDLLFQAFSRIQETAAGQEGVGLGLYVVSQLIGTMEGRIDLTSSARGTTFTVTIPCETRRSQAQPTLGLVDEDSAQA